MVEIFYIDTCIYINSWQKEENGGVLYWRIAEKLFEKIEQEMGVVYFSEYILKELEYVLTEEQFKAKIALFDKGIYRKIELGKEEKNIARQIEMEINYEIGFYDIIHMLLAKKISAILITRDRKLLDVAKSYGIDAKKPEEVI